MTEKPNQETEQELTDFPPSDGEEKGDSLSDISESLDEIARQRDEYCDLLLRKQAEFENYRKRVDREKSEVRLIARKELLGELLPILDACEKGLDSMRADEEYSEQDTFIEGYELLLRQLRSVLEKYEVAPVPGVGATFDPNIHEAVMREVSRDYEENEIVEEYRKGYLIGDQLLRPSQVKVAVWPVE